MRWNDDLYCTHPYHILNNGGSPEKITEDKFKIKNCGNQKNGSCRWLVSYKCKSTKPTKAEKKQNQREHELLMRCQQQGRRIRLLTDEVIELTEKYKELQLKYNQIVSKINLEVLK